MITKNPRHDCPVCNDTGKILVGITPKTKNYVSCLCPIGVKRRQLIIETEERAKENEKSR